jgi:hypothetical protein
MSKKVKVVWCLRGDLLITFRVFDSNNQFKTSNNSHNCDNRFSVALRFECGGSFATWRFESVGWWVLRGACACCAAGAQGHGCEMTL